MAAPSDMPAIYAPQDSIGYEPLKAPLDRAMQQQAVEAQRFQQRDAYFQSRGLDIDRLMPGNIQHQQAAELPRYQGRDAYFLSRGLDARQLLPGRRTARQAHEQLYGAESVVPSTTTVPTERAEELPEAAAPKKRGKRMKCATCLKDAPVNKDNDGVNCTKCYKKILKAQQRETGL